MKRIQRWFPTLIYCAPLGRGAACSTRAARGCGADPRSRRRRRRWSQASYPGGYTSYGSLDRLHRFSSTFGELRERIDRHVRAYSRAQGWDLRGRKLAMTDCWVNVMPRGCAHSFHLHPQSVISGTYYVRTPRGSPGLKFEDPRLSRLMAAPPRKAHISYPARAGEVILFESWLRHEVPAHRRAPSASASASTTIS